MRMRALDVGLQQISDALAAHPNAVRWDVGPGAFLFQGAAVWAPDRIPFDRIPYQLFADGVRHIQIKEGFTKDEFRDLVAILLRDVVGGAGSEDDAVTAFWDRRFEHVAYVAIEAFAEGDGSGDADPVMRGSVDLARELARSAQLDRDWHDASLEGRAMRLNLSTQLRESGEAAAALALDPLQRATMGAQLNMTDDRWLERFVDAFADGYVDARITRTSRCSRTRSASGPPTSCRSTTSRDLRGVRRALGGASRRACPARRASSEPPSRS